MLHGLVRHRRMVRAFADAPVDPAVVDELLELARHAPSAGHSQGTAFVVLEGGETSRLWDITLPPARRAAFRWQGLLRAPVLVVVCCSPDIYVARYAEPDKGGSRLGLSAGDWPVPYWWVDAGAVIQNLLLGVVAAGLGACLFGLFEHEAAVLSSLGVPDGWRAAGVVAIGHSAQATPGRSAQRGWRPASEVVHRGRW